LRVRGSRVDASYLRHLRYHFDLACFETKRRMRVDGRGWLEGFGTSTTKKGITMVNDRMMMRMAILFALAALPSLASSQAMKSAQSKAPDWKGKEVTHITIDGSYQQLTAFKEELPAAITKGLAEQTIVLSPSGKNKLVYSYLTETGDSPVSGFYSALKSSTEKAKAQKPPVMHTSIYATFPCRPGTCAGQQSWIGPRPPCPC
jgi:hypothetical protein